MVQQRMKLWSKNACSRKNDVGLQSIANDDRRCILTKTKDHQQINSKMLWSNTEHPVQLTTCFENNQKGGCPDTLDTPPLDPPLGCECACRKWSRRAAAASSLEFHFANVVVGVVSNLTQLTASPSASCVGRWIAWMTRLLAAAD